MGETIAARLPHSKEAFLLVDIGCGCGVFKIDKSLYTRRFAGIPLVFGIDDARSLPLNVESIDAEKIRKPLNPWFTPRVYAFKEGSRLAFAQPYASPKGLLDPLQEARRALERP